MHSILSNRIKDRPAREIHLFTNMYNAQYPTTMHCISGVGHCGAHCAINCTKRTKHCNCWVSHLLVWDGRKVFRTGLSVQIGGTSGYVWVGGWTLSLLSPSHIYVCWKLTDYSLPVNKSIVGVAYAWLTLEAIGQIGYQCIANGNTNYATSVIASSRRRRRSKGTAKVTPWLVLWSFVKHCCITKCKELTWQHWCDWPESLQYLKMRPSQVTGSRSRWRTHWPDH